MIVVDASVAAKWLFLEPGSQVARAVAAGPEKLFAPDLLRIEVAAAITRRARVGGITAAEAEVTARAWLRMVAGGGIVLSPDETDLPEAVRLALGIAHPLQDCLYPALAIRLGADLITADPTFIRRASPLYPQVRPLLP